MLLALDWRSGIDGAAEFTRFAEREVPLYAGALRSRGAIAAWCCREDARTEGWRDAIAGLGFPARGMRTYYVIEHGNVVAWRALTAFEVPVALVAPDAQPSTTPKQGGQADIERQFTEILTSLIIAGEAIPPLFRSRIERSADVSLRRHNPLDSRPRGPVDQRQDPLGNRRDRG